MTESQIEPLSDWQSFYEELQKESPRGAVLVASAFLDDLLRNLLSKFLVPDSKAVDELLGTMKILERPLSTFSSRIRAAYCMGLITQSEYHDLNQIKRIRNGLAHRMHGYNFDTPEIVSWCKSLKLAKMMTAAIPDLPSSHGNMFLLGVTQLVMRLQMSAIEAGKEPMPNTGAADWGQAVNDQITRGRAYVRLIEAAEVLLAGNLDEAERVLLGQVRQVYKQKLRALVGSLPPALTAQILTASENINAPVGEYGKN